MILRSLPGSRFSIVNRAWEGRAAVLIGGGPSLTLEQVERVRGAREAGQVRVIAINDAYLWAPWADVLYAADSHWWAWHSAGVAKPVLGLTAADVRERFEAFAGQRCSIWNTGQNIRDDDVHLLRNFHGNVKGHGLSLDPEQLVTGWNGGYQALNLAILAGAKTVLLLGFDGQPAKDGRTHWSGGHPRPTPEAAYPEYRRAFSAGEAAIEAAGVKVINCSPGSEINSFEKMAIEEALAA